MKGNGDMEPVERSCRSMELRNIEEFCDGIEPQMATT